MHTDEAAENTSLGLGINHCLYSPTQLCLYGQSIPLGQVFFSCYTLTLKPCVVLCFWYVIGKHFAMQFSTKGSTAIKKNHLI